MRGSARRLIHVAVALVLAKPAISVTLVVGVKLVAASGAPVDGTDGVAALGTLISGFTCFAIAGFSPWVIFRLLPSVEGAVVSSGIVGGWGRSAMFAAQVGMMAKSAGASMAGSAATKAIPSQAAAGTASAGAQSPASGATTGGGQGASATTPVAGSIASWAPSAGSAPLDTRTSRSERASSSSVSESDPRRATPAAENAPRRTPSAPSASEDES